MDKSYYARRARQELVLAEQAAVPAAARIHYQLAAAYLAKCGSTDVAISISEQPIEASGEFSVEPY